MWGKNCSRDDIGSISGWGSTLAGGSLQEGLGEVGYVGTAERLRGNSL